MKKHIPIEVEQLASFAKIDLFTNSTNRVISCIGDNSGQLPGARDFSIADGFKQNVDILYFALINCSEFTEASGISPLEDTLVYPIWFSARHTLELYLKLAIKRVHWVWSKKGIKPLEKHEQQYTKALRSHNIEELTEIFKELLIIDNETKLAFDEMKYFDDMIADYFFDVDSDAFRYTFKPNQTDINLDGKSVLDVTVLYDKFLQLYKQLDWFCNCVCVSTIEDYKTATFTTKLNRGQIEEISKKLPPRKEWGSDEFTRIKKEICTNFKLSGKDFIKAIDIIEKHREFSANIGVEIVFGSLSEACVDKLCDLIKISKKIDEVPLLPECYEGYGIVQKFPESVNYAKENYDKLIELRKIFYELGDAFLAVASQDEIALLHAFKEVATPVFPTAYYSEDIDMLLRSWSVKRPNANYTITKLAKGYKYILKGFEMCGQKTYLDLFRKHLGCTEENA